MSRNYEAEAKAFGKWYHAIKISPEYVTESYMPVFDQWASNRKVRAFLDYKNKSVLDLGTMDGMWAFEAEQLGAKHVVAADIWQNCEHGMQRFLLAREAIQSKVWPITNGDVHCLYDRVADMLKRLQIPGFDIVQNLGLMYHVQNPMLAFHQVRKCMKIGGQMLLETAFWNTPDPKPMARFNSDLGIYDDNSTYWAMNQPCLYGMLKMCGFYVRENTVSTVGDTEFRRMTVICDAIPSVAATDNYGA